MPSLIESELPKLLAGYVGLFNCANSMAWGNFFGRYFAERFRKLVSGGLQTMGSKGSLFCLTIAMTLLSCIQVLGADAPHLSEAQAQEGGEKSSPETVETPEPESSTGQEGVLQPSTGVDDDSSPLAITTSPLSVACHRKWRIYAQAEALALWRSNSARYQPFILNSATGAALATTDSLKFDLTPGARFVLGATSHRGLGWEATYFGLQNWNSSSTVQGNNNLRIPGDIALATLDFKDADQMRLRYTSDLQNAEFNSFLSDGIVSVLAGFRYVHVADHFNIQATDANSGTSDYTVRAQNDLFGAQVGLRVKERWGRWSIEASSKVGLYGNACQQRTFLGDFDNTFVLRNSRATAGTAALVTDLNVAAVYRLTRVWGVRCGFDLLFLDGIALAPDQLDFTDTPTSGLALHRTGDMLFVGGSLGLQARW